jgi:hypothetical protein
MAPMIAPMAKKNAMMKPRAVMNCERPDDCFS